MLLSYCLYWSKSVQSLEPAMKPFLKKTTFSSILVCKNLKKQFCLFFLMAWLTVYLPFITPQGYINSIIMYSTGILTTFDIHMGPVQWWHSSDCLRWEGSEKHFLCLCETDIIQSMGSNAKKMTQLSASVQSVGVWESDQVETKQDRI